MRLFPLLTKISIFLFICSLAFAQPSGKGVVSITEEDSDPEAFPWQIKVTNGTLTDNGDGTASLSISGGGAAASDITTDTSNFDNNLSAADDDVQKALDTLDDLSLASAGGWTDDGSVVRLTTADDLVGIGTTGPRSRLEIGAYAPGGAATPNDIIINTLLGKWTIRANDSDSPSPSGQTGYFSILNDDIDKLIIFPNGNVGIGTVNPLQKLALGGALGILEGSASPQYYTIFQGGDQAADVSYTLPTALPASNKILQSTSTGVLSWVAAGAASAAGSDGQVQYNDGGNLGGATNLYYDDVNNNVGIGTTVPIHILDIVGASGVGIGTTAANDAIIVDNTGYVGIGTPIPTAPLEIVSKGNSTAPFKIRHSGQSATLGFFWESSTGESEFYLRNASDANTVVLDTNGPSYLKGGNVGIGTSSPIYRMDLLGSGSYFGIGTTTPGEFMAVVASGNVGIGTTNPIYKMHIVETDNDEYDLALKDYNAGNYGGGINFFHSRGTPTTPTATQSGDYLGNLCFRGWTNTETESAQIGVFAGSTWTASNAESYMSFSTTPNASVTASERMRITSQGNLGIGTTSSTFKVGVLGNLNLLSTTGDIQFWADFGEFDFARSSSVATANSNILLKRTRGTWAAKTSVVSGDTLGTIGWLSYEATTPGFRTSTLIKSFAEGNTTNTSVPGNLTFWTTPTNSIVQSERMRIDNQGNIGIGTTTVRDKLDVANSTIMVADNTVDLSDVTDAWVLTFDSGTNTWAGEAVASSSGGWTDDGAVVRLTTIGDNVGIGTTAAVAKLDLIGASGVGIGTSASKDAFVIASSGNVGVGSTVPLYKLDVNGRIGQQSVMQQFSGTKTLSDGSATAFASVTVAPSQCVGGYIVYSIYVSGSGDFQSHTGTVAFNAVNKSGVVTSDIEETYLAASESEVASSGTLTDAWTITNGAGNIVLNSNANTDLGTPTITLYYTIFLHANSTITAV